jgi:hypothetical protein
MSLDFGPLIVTQLPEDGSNTPVLPGSCELKCAVDG